MKAIYNSNNRITDLRAEYNSSNCIEIDNAKANEITSKINDNYSVFLNADNTISYVPNVLKMKQLKQIIVDKELRIIADYLLNSSNEFDVDTITLIQLYIKSLKDYLESLVTQEDIDNNIIPERPAFMTAI